MSIALRAVAWSGTSSTRRKRRSSRASAPPTAKACSPKRRIARLNAIAAELSGSKVSLLASKADTQASIEARASFFHERNGSGCGPVRDMVSAPINPKLRVSKEFVDGAHPVDVGPQARQIGGLDNIAEPVLPAPGRLLLHGEVVDETAHACELPEQGLLLGQRFQLVAEAAGDSHGLFLSPGAHLTNHSRCTDAQPPRPQSQGFRDFR